MQSSEISNSCNFHLWAVTDEHRRDTTGPLHDSGVASKDMLLVEPSLEQRVVVLFTAWAGLFYGAALEWYVAMGALSHSSGGVDDQLGGEWGGGGLELSNGFLVDKPTS